LRIEAKIARPEPKAGFWRQENAMVKSVELDQKLEAGVKILLNNFVEFFGFDCVQLRIFHQLQPQVSGGTRGHTGPPGFFLNRITASGI
jgi:hypothetical protein